MRNVKLTWSAVFEDGSVFSQYQDDQEKSSENIPRAGLRKFCLVRQGRVFFVRELIPGWRFFYRRRTAMEQGGPIQVMHIIGWQIPIGEEYLTQMAFIYEEDLSILIGDMFLGQPQPILGKLFHWRHPIEFVSTDLEIII